MGFFDKKIRQIENTQVTERNEISKTASDKITDLVKDLSGAKEANRKRVIDNVIVFTNVSGGTGVSTLVSNVAYTATQKGLKVLLIDLNIEYPVQHTYLGISQVVERPDLVSYLLGENKLNECIDNTKTISLLSANNRNLSDMVKCNNKTSIVNFNEMIDRVRQYYDLVLIDSPMRIDNMLHNVLFYRCDAIYTVWDEGIASLINPEKVRRNMALTGIDSFTKMRVILNKRTSVHFSDYPLKKLNMELVEVLPFDIDIIENSLKGQIFCEKGSSSSKNAIEFARKIEDLTSKILKIGGYIE